MVLLMPLAITPPEPDFGQLRLKFDGGLATNGSLALEDYAASLAGWNQFFRLAGDIYLRSLAVGGEANPKELLQIKIHAERPGSYEALVEFTLQAVAAGVIGNRVDAAVVWSCNRLFGWYRKVAQTHLAQKRKTTNIDELVAALEQMANSENVQLVTEPVSAPVGSDQFMLPFKPEDQKPIEDALQIPTQNPRRVVAEKINGDLELASRPVEKSCDTLVVTEASTGDQIIYVGRAERAILAAPLSPPPPTGDWRRASVKFVRINRKTGKALFYFASDVRGENNSHYSVIIDPAVSSSGNVYTTAFNDDTPLNAYIRQGRAEPGHLSLLWEITVHPPERTLF
jgi:hypothetical protein